jgi:hypothetical protein
MLAGALQRKVHLIWGFEKIHPNLFVVLVGPSGKTRKGVALGIAKDMLCSVGGIAVAPEATTREAVISAMKRAITNYQDPSDARIKFHCSLTAFSEELSVFLGQNDIKFLANLTDWYDSKDNWAYETIGRGRDSLQGVCFNLLGATAPDWIQSMLPQEAVGGGFTARIIFVVEDRKGKTVPKHTLTEDEHALAAALARDLERVNQIAGAFKFSPEGEKAYTDWYSEQDALLAKGRSPIEDPRFDAYCERRSTHLRKVMMLMSVSRGDELILTQNDFDRALKILQSTELKMHRTFGGLGQAKYSDMTEKVMGYIQALGTTTRSVLMSKFYRDIDANTLKIIEEVMTQMRVVKVTLLEKGDKLYEWIKK